MFKIDDLESKIAEFHKKYIVYTVDGAVDRCPSSVKRVLGLSPSGSLDSLLDHHRETIQNSHLCTTLRHVSDIEVQTCANGEDIYTRAPDWLVLNHINKQVAGDIIEQKKRQITAIVDDIERMVNDGIVSSVSLNPTDCYGAGVSYYNGEWHSSSSSC